MKKTEKNIGVGRVKCSECSGWMIETKTKVHGFPVRAWKCKKCNELELDILDVTRAQLLNKIKNNPLKIISREMTDGVYIRFPKKYSELIPVGTEVQITPKDEDELIMKIGNLNST